MSSLAQRFFDLKATLQTTELIAVTKQASLDQFEELYQLGHRDFAENRVDQLLERAELLEQQGLKSIRWHFIGNLQTNKCNKLFKVPNLYAIHSIDRLSILEKVLAKKSDVQLFLQVKTSPDSEKSGFVDEADLRQALIMIQQYPQVFTGLMTMASIGESSARISFARLRELRDRLCPKAKLSMGMSGDYLIACEYGADFVRIGSTLFSL